MCKILLFCLFWNKQLLSAFNASLRQRASKWLREAIKLLPMKEAVLFAIPVFYWIFTSVIQSPRFTNDYEFFISVSTYQ